MDIIKNVMNEKVLSVVRPTPFTTYYTVKRTDGFIEKRTVHRCPKCGVTRLIIRNDENSMLWADIVFGFRSCNGNEYIQSFCRSCRCRPRSTVSKSLVNVVVRYILSNGGTNNG